MNDATKAGAARRIAARSGTPATPPPHRPGNHTTTDEAPLPRPKVASPPATSKGRRSSEAFRRAAVSAFAGKGFLNTTVADIAAEAGRSPAAFYYHFESKEDVLVALFSDFRDAVLERASRMYEPGAGPREQIDQLIRNFITTYQEWRPVLTAVFQQSMVDEQFYAHWRSIRQDAVRAIRSWVVTAQRAGAGHDLDADLAASALAAMLDGFCYMWLARDGDLPDVSFDLERAQHTLSALCYRSLYSTD